MRINGSQVLSSTLMRNSGHTHQSISRGRGKGGVATHIFSKVRVQLDAV